MPWRAVWNADLIVGVLIATFHEIKRREDEACTMGVILTDKQRAWVDVVQQLLVLHPKHRAPPPEAAWRAWCYRLTAWPHFEPCVMVVIVHSQAF